MSELFQKSALDSIATPEQLDQQTRLIKPQIWLGITAFCILVISVMVWSILGNINSAISMKGIVFPKHGVSTVFAEHDGNVQDVLYQIGDSVKTGDIIAVMPDQKLLTQLEYAQEQYDTAVLPQKKQEWKQERELLQESYEKASIIRAKQDGVIQDIVSYGEYVETGDMIVSILVNSQNSNNRQILAYVPLRVANRLEIGMEAQICPSYVSREEYGYMEGFIFSVGKVPVTEESLLNYYGTTEYVKDILAEESCVEVCISVQMDEESSNRFRWSSEKGRKLPVEVGTICNVQTIMEQKRPIELLIGR